MSHLRLQYKWVVKLIYRNGGSEDLYFKTRKEARWWKNNQPEWLKADFEIYKVTYFPNLKALMLTKTH